MPIEPRFQSVRRRCWSSGPSGRAIYRRIDPAWPMAALTQGELSGVVMMHNERIRFSWWSCAALVTGLVAGGVLARAQPPDDPPGPPQAYERKGLLHRWIYHSAATLQDKMIGYPDTFAEPPLGYFVKEQMSMQVAKADPHRFTLYRTDFLPGTDRFSPVGAYRFNLMYSRPIAWS